MAHESNWSGNIGSQNPGRSAEYFRERGMSHDQASEAAAAARRAQEQANNKS